mmetsp:Transcript_9972/g.30256  ORF Transcript_9972/g.30256 Transcript_9972/m.30256 type:complete len:966 (-) Transcript_9972:530-3427(-)
MNGLASRPRGGFFSERDADSDMNWRRSAQRTQQREKPKEQPKPEPPHYSAPPAPWVNAAPQQTRAVDDAAFPTLGAEAVPETTVSRSRDNRVAAPKPSAWGRSEPVLKTQTAADPSWPSLAAHPATPPQPEKTKAPPAPKQQQQPNANPFKPKPQKSYCIVDAVVRKADKQKATQQKTPSSKGGAAADSKSEQKKKAERDSGKPKKRKLSSLKKRVLLERLELYKEWTAPSETVRVKLLNAARVEEVEDDDDREEVLRDVADMCAALGAPPRATAVTEVRGEFAVIAVTFDSAAKALTVTRGLRGRVLGGVTLEMTVVKVKKKKKRPHEEGGPLLLENDDDDDETEPEEEPLALEDDDSSGREEAKIQSMLVAAQELRLVGVVSKEDRARIEDDEEELDEIVDDLRDLVESKCGLSVVAVDVVQSTGDAVVSLETTDRADAERGCETLSKVQLGGEAVAARLNERAQLRLENVCEALDDDEEVRETESDLANVCRRKLSAFNDGRGDFVNAVSVVLSDDDRLRAGDAILETKLDAALALSALRDQLVLGGVTIPVELLRAGDEATSLLRYDEKNADDGDAKKKEFYGGLATDEHDGLLVRTKRRGRVVKIPAKYAEAYALELYVKRGLRDKDAFSASSSRLTTNPLDAELDAAVAGLLTKLHEFQQRVRQNDPLKAKMRRRLVVGLRETRNGVRADNVKMLVLAPNVDESRTLDESVAELVSVAAEHDVPVVYALTKRAIGSALRKPVGVSAVGVYSADGANDDFRAVVKRHRAIRRDPSLAVHPRDHQRRVAREAAKAKKQQQHKSRRQKRPAEGSTKADEEEDRAVVVEKEDDDEKREEVGKAPPRPLSYLSAVRGAAADDDDREKAAPPEEEEEPPTAATKKKAPKKKKKKAPQQLTATAPAWTSPTTDGPVAPLLSSSLSAATPVFCPTPYPPAFDAPTVLLPAPPLLYAYAAPYWPGGVS